MTLCKTTFDDLYRRRTVTNGAGKRITYAYDAVGQRAHMIDPDGGRFGG